MQAARIAVVEDERVVAYHLGQQLKRLGYSIAFIASSSKQVAENLQQNPPDLILMDIRIEGDKDGIEVASQLAPDLNIPVIYLTAYSEEETLDRARNTKPYGYLLKPFSERELHATIQMAIERKGVERSLRESREQLNLALDAADMAPWELNLENRKLRLSAGKRISVACRPAESEWEMELDNVMHSLPEGDADQIEQALEQLAREGAAINLDFRIKDKDSSMRWLRAQGRKRANATAGPVAVGVVRDVSALKTEEEKLRQAATIFDATREGLLILDQDFRVVTANPGYQRMTGFSAADLLGSRPAVFDTMTMNGDRETPIADILRATGNWCGDLHTNSKDGGVVYLFANIIAVGGEQDEPVHYVVACSDLTAIRQAERELHNLAHYDRLTGLPNRLLGTDRLEHAINRSRRERQKLALLFVDLDNFKPINDTLGHRAGDEVLKIVAETMRNQIRNMDTVARFAGDEFVVILEGIGEANNAAGVARKLIDALSKPIQLAGRQITVGASIGISIYPSDGQDQETLIQAADTAMYAAKNAGGGGYAFYNPEMTEQVRSALMREQELRLAVNQGQLRLHFQPQISIYDRSIVGMEALVRWQHPEKGLLGAEEVIPVAEKSDLIVRIGEWVLHEACRQAAAWRDAGLLPFRIAVNASATQIRNGRLHRSVSSALAQSGIDASLLEIEITESVSQDDPDSIATLNALKEIGVSIAIDDFGIGYSCLASLKSLPIHRLKIDRAFVSGLPLDRNDAMITETIIAIAQGLNLEVIAEGIETAEQENFLQQAGCLLMQGYRFAKPMPAEAVADFVANWPGKA